jgi:ABC-type bacteriocin/lantibiotic exporter with double-glycine peptidase domain
MSSLARYAAIAFAIAASGCYAGSARDVSPRRMSDVARDPSWRLVSGVPFVAQSSDRDCGPAALSMVLAFHGVPVTPAELAGTATGSGPSAVPDEQGVRAGVLRDVARAKGLEAFVVSGTLVDLLDQISRGRPVLVGLAKPLLGGRALTHYEVVVGLNREKKKILSLDPARGLRENTLEGFAREWVPTKQVTIVVFPRAVRG